MALAGTLKDFSLADIFQLIGLQKKTGVLTLKNNKEEARILFMNGLVVGADTNSQKLENRLGHVLVKSNRISQDELEQALANQGNTLQRLGQVLVQKGFIKQEDLRDSLQTQTTQIIYRLFRWIDGEYHFKQERFVDYDQENFQPITSESILMEGVRMLDEWPMIEAIIPDFEVLIERTEEGKSIQLQVEDNFSMDVVSEESFNSLLEGVMSDSSIDESRNRTSSNLSHGQELVLKLIDGPSIVQDIIDKSGMNEFETCRAIYDLIDMGLVQKVSDEDLEAAQVVIEKEQEIPTWIPASLMTIIAIFCFVLAWNPLNQFFPFPNTLNQTELHFEASSRYQLDKLSAALELYYFQKGSLPVNLNMLIRQSLLKRPDLTDSFGRTFLYEPNLSNHSYKLYARDISGARGSGPLARVMSLKSNPVVEDEP